MKSCMKRVCEKKKTEAENGILRLWMSSRNTIKKLLGA